MSSLDEAVPYAPVLTYLCDEPSCCPNGCPSISCLTCGEDWPCREFRESHTAAQNSSASAMDGESVGPMSSIEEAAPETAEGANYA